MEKDEFLMVLEGNLLEEWVGIRMVILVLDSLYCGIILIQVTISFSPVY
jgi:hypothetical protein